MQNFDAPYAASGPRDFWRRWHISLSTWLRDYLYVPLGGNRAGPTRTQRNLLVTMVLGGLWHGAAGNYLLWGAYHGVLLVVARVRAVEHVAQRVPLLLRRVLFFHLVCLGWALFRARSLADCGVILGKLLSPSTWGPTHWLSEVAASGEGPYLALMMTLVALVVFGQMIFPRDSFATTRAVWRAPWALRVYFVVLALAACVTLAPEAAPPFIYFQF